MLQVKLDNKVVSYQDCIQKMDDDLYDKLSVLNLGPQNFVNIYAREHGKKFKQKFSLS